MVKKTFYDIYFGKHRVAGTESLTRAREMTKQDKAFIKGSNIQEHVVKEVWKDGKRIKREMMKKLPKKKGTDSKRMFMWK